MSVKAKMNFDPHYASEYRKFMSDYEALGHMCAVPDDALQRAISRVSYLPVWQITDRTKKLRVVLNASSKISCGPSMNDCLFTGEPLQSDFIIIISRWRLLRVAVGTDIEKMYRQILVDQRDIDLQRIICLESDGQEKHYQLFTVIYGVSCASYLALSVKSSGAQSYDECGKFPRAAQILLNSSYFDDSLRS